MLSVIVPAYNEEEGIIEVLKDIQKTLKGLEISFEIIVVNDGSTDRTQQRLETVKDVIVIQNPYNLGYGASLLKGIKHAKGDFILITDADGTYPCDAIPNLYKQIQDYDCVVGARTGENIPFLRKPAKLVLKYLAQFLTGKKIPDLNSGLRIFRKEIVLNHQSLFPTGFSFTTTLTLLCLLHNYTITFLPIRYLKRRGISSIKPVRDFFGFIQLIFRIIIYFNPLKFFLIPGIICLIFGFFVGGYQAYISIFILKINPQIGDMPTLSILTGLQFVSFGIIADIIAKNRK